MTDDYTPPGLHMGDLHVGKGNLFRLYSVRYDVDENRVYVDPIGCKHMPVKDPIRFFDNCNEQIELRGGQWYGATSARFISMCKGVGYDHGKLIQSAPYPDDA